MQPIDPILVEIIDSLNEGRPCGGAAEKWTGRSEEYRTTIERESDYSLSESEQSRLVELPKLLSEVDRQVDAARANSGDPEELLGAGIRFFAHLSELKTDREETFFVPIPEFDKLLCAGKCLLENRVESLALRRIQAAKQERERIEALFSPHAESFPAEFQDNMEEGFELLDEALAALEQSTAAPNPEVQNQALSKLNRGGQMVATFPVAVREIQKENRRHVPVIGSLLETIEVDPAEQYLTLLRKEGLPQLRALWSEKDDGWLLPPTQAEPIIAEVSTSLDQFELALTNFKQNPDAFWASVKRLENAFREVRSNSMPIQNVLDSSLGPEASLILALLEGKAPDYAVATAVKAMRAGDVPDFITDLANGLEEYLESKEKLVLLELIELLLEQQQ